MDHRLAELADRRCHPMAHKENSPQPESWGARVRVRWPLTLALAGLVALVYVAYKSGHEPISTSESALISKNEGNVKSYDSSQTDIVAISKSGHETPQRLERDTHNELFLELIAPGAGSTRVRALPLNDQSLESLGSSHWPTTFWIEANELAVEFMELNKWRVVITDDMHELGIALYADGYYAEVITLDLDQIDLYKPVTVALKRSESLRVKVVGSDRLPISGVTVHARSSDLGLPAVENIRNVLRHRWYWHSEVTDNTGYAVFLSPPADLVSLYADPVDDYASAILWEHSPMNEALLVLQHAYRIHGLVLSDHDIPLEGVLVAAYATDCGWVEEPLMQAYTDNSGRYSLEGLPADSRPHFVRAIKEGFNAKQSQPIRAQAGDSIDVSFNVSKAVSCDILVQDLSGSTLAECQLTVHEAAGTRLPFVAQTDAHGQARLPRMIAPEERYYLSVNVNNFWAASELFSTTGTSDAALPVVLATIGKLVRVQGPSDGDSLEGAEGIWYPTSGAPNGVAFSIDALPAWLPAGDGVIEVLWPSGRRASSSASIQAGRDNTVSVQDQRARLTVVLDDAAVDELRVYSIRNERYATVSTPVGTSYFDLPCGEYYLYIKAGSRNTEYGPFALGAQGLQISALDYSGDAVVSGRVIDESGEPLAKIPVHAVGSSGYRPQSQITDDNGYFEFGGLPLGQYVIRCEAEQFLGGRTPDCEIQTFVGCNAHSSGHVLQLLGTGVTVRPRIPIELWSSTAAVQVFVICDGKKFSATGSRAAELVLPEWCRNRRAVAGIVITRPGGIEVHVSDINELVDGIAVSLQPMRQFDVGVEAGIHSQCPVSVLGYVVGYSGLSIDSPEGIAVSTNRPDLVSVYIPAALSAAPMWLRLDDIVSGTAQQRLVEVRDTLGRAIVGASIVARSSGNRAISDSNGIAALWALGKEWIWVDHSRYWAEQRMVLNDNEVFILRGTSRVDELVGERYETATEVQIRPTFDLGYDFWSQEQRLRRGNTGWRVPVFPAGTYVLSLKGPLMGSLLVELTESGQVIIRD